MWVAATASAAVTSVRASVTGSTARAVGDDCGVGLGFDRVAPSERWNGRLVVLVLSMVVLMMVPAVVDEDNRNRAGVACSAGRYGADGRSGEAIRCGCR